MNLTLCYKCGELDHYHTECNANLTKLDYSNVRCYVCLQKGHLVTSTLIAGAVVLNSCDVIWRALLLLVLCAFA